MNRDTQLIWEKQQKQNILLENSDLVWQAIEESLQMFEETKITPDMVNQINQQIGTNLTIDQLNKIQTITNPGMAKTAGGALGKLGGFMKNLGGKALGVAKNAYGTAKDQVTDPNSALRQGVDKGMQMGKQAAGAVASGVSKGADAIAAGAQAAGQAAGDFAKSAEDGYDSTQDPTKRDPKTGRYMTGNQSGVQFAERNILNRPGWNNKELN